MRRRRGRCARKEDELLSPGVTYDSQQVIGNLIIFFVWYLIQPTTTTPTFVGFLTKMQRCEHICVQSILLQIYLHNTVFVSRT